MSKKLKKQKFQPQAIIGSLEGALRDLSNFRDPWDDTLDTQSILTTGYRDAKLQRDVVRRMRFIDDLYSDQVVICAFSHVGHGHGRQAAGPTIPTRQRRIWRCQRQLGAPASLFSAGLRVHPTLTNSQRVAGHVRWPRIPWARWARSIWIQKMDPIWIRKTDLCST